MRLAGKVFGHLIYMPRGEKLDTRRVVEIMKEIREKIDELETAGQKVDRIVISKDEGISAIPVLCNEALQ
jgi:hypothetical protein